MIPENLQECYGEGGSSCYDPSSGEPDAGYYHGIKELARVIGEVKSTTCETGTIISRLIQKSEAAPVLRDILYRIL